MTWWLSDDAPADGSDPDGPGHRPVDWVWRELGHGSGPAVPDGTSSPEGMALPREEEMEEAYRRGFREGEAAGVAMALEEIGPARAAVEKVSEGLACLQESLERHHQENLFALALAVARQVVGREVETDPKIVADLVRTALSHFPLDQKVKVRVNPADLSALSGEASAESLPLTAGREVRWIPDEAVARGGCIVEGPEHVVDGRLDTALERIYRKVFDG